MYVYTEQYTMGHFAGKPVAVALRFDQRYCYLPFIVMASPCLASAAEESLDLTSCSAAVLTTAAQPSQQTDLAQVSPEQLTHDLPSAQSSFNWLSWQELPQPSPRWDLWCLRQDYTVSYHTRYLATATKHRTNLEGLDHEQLDSPSLSSDDSSLDLGSTHT